MRKEISILVSAVFIFTLISSAPVQSVRVSGAENQDFLYSVSVSPTFVRVQQGEFGTFDVKVQRGSEEGAFIVDLSLTADSSLPRGAVSFNPPTLNLEQGQTVANSTIKINSHGLDTGSLRFRIGAATHAPVGSDQGPDQAVSNTAALIVGPRSNSLEASQSDSSAPSGASASQTDENKVLPESTSTPTPPPPTPTQPNLSPITKAGQDQIINEGERGILDGSASADPDKDALTFTWEQLVPRQPTIKLATSEDSGRASFIAPDVNRDTLFRFNLVVQDGNGGQATDLVNILIKNVVVTESSATSEPQAEQQEQPQQQQQNQVPSPQAGETPSENASSTKNHSPTAEALQTIFASDGNPLSASLKGTDPDKEDSISYVIVSEPSRGTIAGFDKATGSLTYVPASGFTGQDRFSFKVVDSHGAESNVGLILIREKAASSPSLPTSPPSPTTASQDNATSPYTVVINASATKTNSKPDQNNKNNTAGTNTTALASTAKLPSGNASLQNETMSSFAASSVAAGEVYRFVKDCTGSGTPFSAPHAVDVDSSGNLYVLDTGRNRVQVFDADCAFIRQWGSLGAGNGQFNSPQGISVSPSGNVYVVDTGNNRVQKFTLTGGFLLSWGGKGTGNGQFDTPVEIDHDSQGNSYVADANNKRIVKSLDGQFKAKWGGAGQGQGQMKGPHGIAVDGANFVYVTDNVNNELLKFTNTGSHIKTVPGLNSPHGVTADSQNSVFLTERGANKVKKYDSDLNFLTEFGSGPGSTPGVFNGPDGITVSSSGKVYVTDSGNNKVQLWKPAPTISITADTPQPKWDHEVKVTATVTNFDSTDKAVFVWGDNAPSTEVSPIPQSGTFEVTHVYGIGALSTNPNNLVGKVMSSGNQELAVSQTIQITVQKHATSIGVGVKDPLVCPDCAYTVFGKLLDIDSMPTPQKGVDGKSISFTGSGVSPTLQSTNTAGVTFSGDTSNNLTLSKPVLKMHVGSHITLPPFSHHLALSFTGGSGATIDLTLTKSNNEVTTGTVNVDQLKQFDFGSNTLKEIAITSVDGSTSSSEFAELATLTTSNLAINPSEQHIVKISDIEADDGSYSTLVVNPGSYFSTGLTQSQDATGLKVTAAFGGDLAYLGATSPEVSYDVDSSQSGIGSSTAYANLLADASWTSLTVGAGGSGDVCTVGGVNDVDADKDGICDDWEDANDVRGPSTAHLNTDAAPAHRYIICPSSTATFTAIDTDCPAGAAPDNTATKKYDLCHTDPYSDVWGGAANQRVCPTKGHKDVFVEIDYMSSHVPSDTAIRNVIKAFGNAPFTGQTAGGPKDASGNMRTTGITLHVIKDDSVTARTPFFVFRDPTSGSTQPDDSFFEVKNLKFGTSTERGNADWSTHLKTQKHYIYHYAMWINYYGGTTTTCPAPPGGLSSGLAETLGNDLVVSLGCNFAQFGTAASNAEQAGTFMHELGHNLNLGHGGALVAGRLPIDYNMNCKPNYFSVMSYSRQMPNPGFDTDTSTASNAQSNWEAGFNTGATGVQTALDYSRTTAGPATGIPELTISEQSGIAGANGRTYKVIFSQTQDGSVKIKDSASTFDFNGLSGIQAGTYAGDLNNMGTIASGCPASAPSPLAVPPTGQTLNSYNDWNEINLVWLADTVNNGADAQDGLTSGGVFREMAPPFLDSIKQKTADIIEFIPPPRTDGSHISNAGSSLPLKFRLKDIDGNFVRDASVTMVAKKGATTATGTFVYDLPAESYKFVWSVPSGGTAKGVWQISYIRDFNTPSQVLLQGPEATAAGAPYSYTITVK